MPRNQESGYQKRKKQNKRLEEKTSKRGILPRLNPQRSYGSQHESINTRQGRYGDEIVEIENKHSEDTTSRAEIDLWTDPALWPADKE